MTCRCGDDHGVIRRDPDRVRREFTFIGVADYGLVLELYNCRAAGTLSLVGIGPSPYAEDYAPTVKEKKR